MESTVEVEAELNLTRKQIGELKMWRRALAEMDQARSATLRGLHSDSSRFVANPQDHERLQWERRDLLELIVEFDGRLQRAAEGVAELESRRRQARATDLRSWAEGLMQEARESEVRLRTLAAQLSGGEPLDPALAGINRARAELAQLQARGEAAAKEAATAEKLAAEWHQEPVRRSEFIQGLLTPFEIGG